MPSTSTSRRTHLIAAAAGALVVAAAPAVATAADDILYAGTAAKVRVLADAGTTNRVVLPASMGLTWFTERPQRTAGRTTLGRLAGVWDATGFRADPPNAALVLTRGGTTTTHVVRLSAPRRSGSRVILRARPVGTSARAAGYRSRAALRAGTYRRAALFVDGSAAPPCPSLISQAITCIWVPGSPPRYDLIGDPSTPTYCGVDGGVSVLVQLNGPFGPIGQEIGVPRCPSTSGISAGFPLGGTTGATRVTVAG